ncbi:MAG: type IV secretion system DNA-binding domain-containing protein, partial [Candidatus Dormibacteraceae bacterium]
MRGLVGELARAEQPELANEIKALAGRGRTSVDAFETMRARIGNLLRSHFASILKDSERELLDMDQALTKGITYLSLPAVAASEDVPLFGRILLQDLKQAIARRERGRDHRPTMIVIDEFAALREPEQIQDLLLQARSAGAAIVLSSQFLPRDETLNAAVKGAGLLLALRTTEEDAQHVAGMIGTEKAISMTTQTTNPNLFDTSGTTGMGSVRNVERYLFHPNLIKQLPDAAAVLKLDRPKLGRME